MTQQPLPEGSGSIPSLHMAPHKHSVQGFQHPHTDTREGRKLEYVNETKSFKKKLNSAVKGKTVGRVF